MATVSTDDLISRAREALSLSYCKYSNFPVACCLQTADGTVFTGVNVENASYGATICAERSAIAAAVSAGHRIFKRIVITSNLDEICFPCGICRQVLIEFGDFEVVMVSKAGATNTTTSMQLLPYAFTSQQLSEYQKSQ